MFSDGKFRGCDLTAKDVDVAEQLFGPCDICAKANFTEPPAKLSTREPRADGDSFQADIFFVKDSGARKSPYLILIGRRLGSRSSV
jgi:hypothetical protein